MAVKLSTFLGTSLNTGLDSAGVKSVVAGPGVAIPLDSNTTGDYIKTITNGGGITVVGSGHANDVILRVDSSAIATLSSTQTLTNKTINLTNNTLVATLSQLNAAVSGATLVSTGGAETLTNKTLESPVITTPQITGPGSIIKISTFSLRDAQTTTYNTLLASNNVTTPLTADRTLTLNVRNADRTISLTGNLTLANNFTTSGNFATTLVSTGTTSVTLPTSGTLVSKDGSGNVTIAGTMTAGTFSGPLTGNVTGNVTGTVSTLSNFTTTNLSEGNNKYYTKARVDSDITTTITKAYIDALNVDADTLDGQDGTYYRIDVYNASGTLLN